MVSPAGASTLITSAPRSPSTQHAIGPDQLVEKSTTRIPASGPTLFGTASAKNTDFSMPASSHNVGQGALVGLPRSAPGTRSIVSLTRRLLQASSEQGPQSPI